MENAWWEKRKREEPKDTNDTLAEYRRRITERHFCVPTFLGTEYSSHITYR